MNKIIETIKRGNYEVVDNQGISVTQHFTQCLEKEFADLEAKLAEAQKTIEIQRMSNDALMENNLDLSYDKVDSAYEYAKEMASNWESQYQGEIAELKQQLAEKDEEIETLKEENERNKAEAESQHKSFIDCFKDKMGLTLYYDNIEKQHNQDKISFAVEQLEKVRHILLGHYSSTNYKCIKEVCRDIDKQIDNQIEQLKEMK